MLKDVVASAGQEGHNWLQHFPDVTLSGDTPTSAWLEFLKGPQQMITTNAFPHHHRLTTPEILLQHILQSETTVQTVFEHGA